MYFIKSAANAISVFIFIQLEHQVKEHFLYFALLRQSFSLLIVNNLKFRLILKYEKKNCVEITEEICYRDRILNRYTWIYV